MLIQGEMSLVREPEVVKEVRVLFDGVHEPLAHSHSLSLVCISKCMFYLDPVWIETQINTKNPLYRGPGQTKQLGSFTDRFLRASPNGVPNRSNVLWSPSCLFSPIVWCCRLCLVVVK